MSLNRYAKKRDTVEPGIVEALEAAGWQVFKELPCDLLTYRAGIWRTLECKTPKNKRGDPRSDTRQVKQREFLEATRTPIAVTAEQALAALQ